VTRDTLVWKKGMAEWTAYGQILGVPLPPPPVTTPGPGIACVGCSKVFPESELIDLSGKRICAACKPLVLQKLREGIPIGASSGLYRDGNELVVERDAELPHRCVHCNAEGTWRRQRQFYWNPSWIWLFTLVCSLGVLLLAILTRKRFRMEVSLCPVHQKRRSRGILIAWMGAAMAVGLFWVIIARDYSDDWAALLGVISIFLLLISIWFGSFTANVLTARRIGPRAARFSRACPAFLEKLPEWNHSEL
jgi:hypothetical protein